MSDLAFKSCSKCKKEKDYSAFNKDSSRKDGMSYACKVCRRESGRHYKQKNKDKLLLEQRTKYKENDSFRKTLLEKRKLKLRSDEEFRESRNLRTRELRKIRPEVKTARDLSKQKELQSNPVKQKVRRFTNRAVKLGRIKKEACVVCGSLNSVAHHEDYSKALEVTWLCTFHHADRHKEMKDAGLVWDELGRPVLKEN